MDLYNQEFCGETPQSWKNLPFDAWTAASIGDMKHLSYITNNPEFQNSSAKQKKEIESKDDEKKLNFDYKNAGGWTCLMYAAYYDHADVARWLLEGNLVREYRGPRERIPANPSIKNGLQRTALMLAASCGHNETVETILDSCKSKSCEGNLTVNIKTVLWFIHEIENLTSNRVSLLQHRQAISRFIGFVRRY